MKPDFEQEIVESLTKNLGEAPRSVHIDAYYKGFHAGFTIRSEDNKTFPSKEVVERVEELIALGFKPSWNKETNNDILPTAQTVAVSPVVQAAPDLSPVNAVCPIHGTPLVYKSGISKKTNAPYAFWACTTKNADGTYCQAGSNKK